MESRLLSALGEDRRAMVWGIALGVLLLLFRDRPSSRNSCQRLDLNQTRYRSSSLHSFSHLESRDRVVAVG